MKSRKVDPKKDPNWKRNKMIGTPVSKEVILKELGHPSTWGKLQRKVEFENRLGHWPSRGGISARKATELDIAGLKGYLVYLEKSLKRPVGLGSGLVSEEEEKAIADTETTEITAEIDKYRKALHELEKQPSQVEQYLVRLRRDLMQKRSRRFDLDGQPDEATGYFLEAAFGAIDGPDRDEKLTAIFRAEEALKASQNDLKIAELEKEIQKYQKLLAAFGLTARL